MKRGFKDAIQPPIKVALKKKVKLKQPEPIREQVLAEIEAYEKLCEELGLRPTAIAANRVIRQFQSVRIPRYDPDEVSAYMTSITPVGMHWCWQGLGHSDDSRSSYANVDGCTISGLYEKLVPIHILKRMKVVRELFKREKPKFYVTDYAVPDPDPFISVVFPDGQSVIFGVWDEPGFGDLKTEV